LEHDQIPGSAAPGACLCDRAQTLRTCPEIIESTFERDSDRHARRRIKTSRKTRTQPCFGFDPPALDFD
jgi:hypothetical protein